MAVVMMCCTAALQAQEGLHIASVFERYGRQKSVTMVELNGSVLRDYDMTMYRSLVFNDITPWLDDVLQCIRLDASSGKVVKTQEVMEGGSLYSAYYSLEKVKRNGTAVNRYILFKRGRGGTATLVYIEGPLGEEKLTGMLYKKQK